MSEIKLGSIVKVKTGCVEMTIVRLFNDGESECADCVWSEYDEERGFKERASRYPLAALEIVEKSC